MVEEDYMITTFDNPFNPHTHFKEWYAYDLQLGHNTVDLLGRIVMTSKELSEKDQKIRYQIAVDEIVDEDLEGIYRKIRRDERPIVVPID